MHYLLISLCLITGSTFGSINIAGNLKAIGLFQIHEPVNGGCGLEVKVTSVMTAEAVKWYLQELNTFGQLPFQIGFEAYETCRQETIAAEMAIDVMHRSMGNETIIGVIGPEFSSEAEVISPILGGVHKDKQLVQVGFSTTASELSDHEKYPNFVRVIPRDELQVDMMIQTMIKLEWNRIAVIYEDDAYGRFVVKQLQQRASQENICISLTKALDVQHGISATQISTILNEIILGKDTRPSIMGVVLFASSSTLKKIFYRLSLSGLSPVPVFMISEAMDMDINVFKSSSGNVISKVKGSLVFTPPFKEVKEFSDHWRAIFTNASEFEKESESNPWLIDVYRSVTGCETKDCTFSPLTDTKIDDFFGGDHVYVQYAILAAHALIKGVKFQHQTYQNKDMVSIMKGITIDIGKDFQWSPKSLSDVQMSIDITGEPQIPEGIDDYQLYNFRQVENSHVFDLIKIGGQTNGETNVELNKLRDYSESGEALEWPNTRKGQCLTGTACLGCFDMKEMYDSFIFEPGDIYVVGIVPIFNVGNEEGCGSIRTVGGYQAAESIRFAVEKINSNLGDFAAIFPDTKIGVIILNSCNNPIIAQRKIYNLHSEGIVLSNGSTLKVNDKIVGFIAELVSDVSIAVADTLTRLNYVQISYASSSSKLSNRGQFPYFMRVVTSVDSQAKAITAIVKKIRGNYAQILYSKSSYGEDGRDRLLDYAKKNEVCVIQEVGIGEDSNPNEVYNNLRKYPHAKIIMVFLQTHKVLPVISALANTMNRGEFIFIASTTWHRRRDVIDADLKQTLIGSYTLSFEVYQDQSLRNHMQNLFLTDYKQNPWCMMFLQTKGKCYYDSSFDKRQTMACLEQSVDPYFALDYMDTSAYIATLSLLTGANSQLSKTCSSHSQLCEEFRTSQKDLVEEIKKTKLDLDGTGDKMRVFSDNGDGNLGYRIYNIQRDGFSFDKLNYVEVGRFPLDGTFTFEMDKIVNPTDDELKSVCPNEQACSSCFGKVSPKPSNVTEPSSNVSTVAVGVTPGTAHTASNVSPVTLGVILGISLLAVVVLTGIVIKLYRKGKRQAEEDPYISPICFEDRDGYLQSATPCSQQASDSSCSASCT